MKLEMLDDLMVNGLNKFDREMEAILKIPEECRFIVTNDKPPKLVDPSDEL
eukprot:CAMPEP_0168337572 /NCGR_PEP_ID=MMETSP0213-20121227/12272_1 /TAXON_ID=151035 /ORGANISM="Euplotes harpa, Strain FSP1.4" /LENGTH=50 /DNA_ID=CAMNT_0008343091 /DNA_START=1057 /DNA_END=1209 /DNA_ORIENTATION=-